MTTERAGISMGQLSAVSCADPGVREGIEQGAQRFWALNDRVVREKHYEFLTIAKFVHGRLTRTTVIKGESVDALLGELEGAGVVDMLVERLEPVAPWDQSALWVLPVGRLATYAARSAGLRPN